MEKLEERIKRIAIKKLERRKGERGSIDKEREDGEKN